MSGAQSWSVKGIDPKVREAAREAAARQGMSLGEYLSLALQGGQGGGAQAHQQQPQPQHAPAPPARTPRRTLANAPNDIESDDDWQVGSGVGFATRTTDPTRIAQRIDSIERRTQLAVTGLDRAVSTIDRSVLGLAARIEDAEAAATEAAERITEALEHFRVAGETLSGKLERAEYEAGESRRAYEEAKSEISGVRERLEAQAATAEEVARRADAAASYLTREMEGRDDALNQTLAEARAVAEEAARQASLASADAVNELRRLQQEMSERLADTEGSTRRAVESAVQETREALLEEVVRLEGEIAKRVGAADEVRAEQAALIARIERAEASARESTAGLRQAAGAAIADLRNSQLTLSARVKQVEDAAGAAGTIDVGDLRQAQQDIAERLSALEKKTDHSPLNDALAAFERRLASVEASPKLEEVDGAVKTLDQSLQRLADRIAETESTANTAIRTLEETVSSLGARVEQNDTTQETEAVRALLEQRLDTMAQSVSEMVDAARSELAGQLQAVMEGVAGEGLEEAIADVNRRLASAERRQAQTIEAISLEIKRMSETVDKRLRAVEARNDDAAASAVREELTRMANTLEHRFDEIERREAAAFDRMGLEVGRLSDRLEERVGAVETRSAQAIEHVGEQVARMAERFGQRHETLARELGERMLDSEERAGSKVAEAISSIMQRLQEVEERSQEAITPVQKAVSSVATKLEQFESERGGSTAAEPLYEPAPTPSRRFDDFPSFGDDLGDAIDLTGDPEPYVSPRDAAQPLRAGPLPPTPQLTPNTPPVLQTASDDDIYFEEHAEHQIESDLLDDETEADGIAFVEPEAAPQPEFTAAADEPLSQAFDAPAPAAPLQGHHDDDLLIEDAFDDFASEAPPPPPEDDDFWSPEEMSSAADDAEAGQQPPAVEPSDLFGAEAPALNLTDEQTPAAKNDYLSAARKAAQAQSLPKTRAEPGATPQLSLRGSSRIILWGAASAIAVALVGGAWYMNQRSGEAAVEPQAAPAEPAPQHVLPETADPNAVTGEAPVDPFAVQPGAAPIEGNAPAETPVAGATAPTAAAATQQAVVAAPLAPRNVSLEQAAQGGDLTAQYELGLQRIAAGRTQDGVALLRRSADRGFAMAQYRLAKVYERGEGVPADLAVARQWTERAAAAGNRRAMHDLGVYFARGEGAPLDEAAAFRWFRQAAELGVADSQYNLGVLYQQGRGVNASPGEALFWFMVAARQGDEDAGARAAALEAQLSPTQVQQARSRAQAFRPRAASAVANGEFGQRPWARTGT
ncbi:MAG: SEL1-like repeat protein [Hyphomonadaceae bacterium]|nr:SEL1-like repeat protein [Hyphomonadaceae bacterium]